MTDVNQLITAHLDIWTPATAKKSSAGRGNGGAVSFYGIRKLRELIFDLAVRGSLERQHPNEECLDLGKVIKNKSQGKFGFSPISPEEEPFIVPKNWQFIRFIDALDFSGGSQPPKSTFITEPKDGYVQLIQIRDLGPNPQPVYVPIEQVTKFCSSTDIMIGRYGASVGKVFWGKDGAYNVALVKLANDQGAYTPEFLHLLMSSPLGQSLFLGISRSAQNGFNKGDIAPKVLPLPPLEEQNRIVAKVDELMALCDALERQAEDSLKAHQTLVETCLATLTNGRSPEELTQNWTRIETNFDTLFTTEESIAALEATILTLATQGAFSEYALSQTLASDLPNGWKWVTISDLDPEFQNGASSRGMKHGEPTIVLRLADITANKVDLSETRELQMDARSKQKYSIHENDFLIIRVNGSANLVGRFIRCDADLSAIYCDHFIRMRNISGDINPRYLELVAQSGSVRKQIEGLFVSTAGQKTVNQKHIRSIRFALPPKQEQQNITTTVNGLLKVCGSLRDQLPQENEIASLISDVLTSKIH